MRLSTVCTLAWLTLLAAFAAQEKSPAVLVLLLSAAAIAMPLILGDQNKSKNRG